MKSGRWILCIQLSDRRPFRLLIVMDDFYREALGIEVDFALPVERLIRALARDCSTVSPRYRIKCHVGCGITIMNDRTWLWAVSPLIIG